MSEELDLQMRLNELERLRAEYAAQGKPNIVSFLDGLITDTRSALNSLEGSYSPEWEERPQAS